MDIEMKFCAPDECADDDSELHWLSKHSKAQGRTDKKKKTISIKHPKIVLL